ncbi:hypothetical protein [Pseudothauera rhizosphaerae]|uniref:Type II secretion system protein GspC N-terminal domain-containing protein n=1 Tax=Pseudothauera rhizosphaerae TaxID=2565932 RepID=A0A4S4ALM6_9RHOO|nr:hypothetical protein [Pseudothauera rhizosphaerae]THF60449.1 hypothetical protein E6O51_13285 [Pseudothauera rhizosphaerae]
MRHPWKTIPPARMVHIAGASLVAAGLLFWSYRLLGPEPAPAQRPEAIQSGVEPAGEIVAGWLGPGDVRLNINVIGLVRRQDKAVAVLSINDAPPVAYMSGETLMRDVVLRSVEPDGITVERSGTPLRIAAPARPEPDPSGIVRVP